MKSLVFILISTFCCNLPAQDIATMSHSSLVDYADKLWNKFPNINALPPVQLSTKGGSQMCRVLSLNTETIEISFDGKTKEFDIKMLTKDSLVRLVRLLQPKQTVLELELIEKIENHIKQLTSSASEFKKLNSKARSKEAIYQGKEDLKQIQKTIRGQKNVIKEIKSFAYGSLTELNYNSIKAGDSMESVTVKLGKHTESRSADDTKVMKWTQRVYLHEIVRGPASGGMFSRVEPAPNIVREMEVWFQDGKVTKKKSNF